MSTENPESKPSTPEPFVLPDEVSTVSVSADGIQASSAAQPSVVRLGEGEEVREAAPKKVAEQRKPLPAAVENEVEGAEDFAALFAEGAGGSCV